MGLNLSFNGTPLVESEPAFPCGLIAQTVFNGIPCRS